MISGPGDITAVQVLPRPLAAVIVTTMMSKWSSQWKGTLDKVYEARKAGLITQSGHNVMVYYLRGDGSAEIHCGFETPARFEPAGEVVYSETPSGLAVTTVHRGSYRELGVSYDAMGAWSRRNGY